MKLTKWALSSLIAPVIFTAALLLIFIVFLIKVQKNSQKSQEKDALIISHRIAKSIEQKLKGNLDFINLLAHERAEGNMTESSFQEQVQQYLQSHSEFINITWIDSSFKIATVSPLKGNSHIIGLSIELPEPKRISRLAKEKRTSFYTKPFEAIQSESSFEVWVPVYKGDTFYGLFAGVYSCENLLKIVIPTETHYKARFSLAGDSQNILASISQSGIPEDTYSHQTQMASLGNDLRVQVDIAKTMPFSWFLIVLIVLSILLVLSLGFSLWKIRHEIILRRIIQDSLKKNELILNAQNEQYAIMNEELIETNKRIQLINEELLAAKEHAEESDRLKTAFLQNMSHEIRTPMNAIVGFSSLLEYNYNNKAKLEKFSRIICDRSKDLLDIINDILDIAKIESGQLPVNITECNLEELFVELNSFFTEYQNRINRQHIEFTLQPPKMPAGVTVHTDIVKLKQILINLIGNAFKFTEEGSIKGGCTLKGETLHFFISDTGIGIPPEKYEVVFERFSQLNQAKKQATGGTGLGLSIVKGLLDLLGGEISVVSEPCKGSTFSFTLPVNGALQKTIHEEERARQE